MASTDGGTEMPVNVHTGPGPDTISTLNTIDSIRGCAARRLAEEEREVKVQQAMCILRNIAFYEQHITEYTTKLIEAKAALAELEGVVQSS